MKDDAQLLKEFYTNVRDFFAATSVQRNEILRAYEYRDCNQWEPKDLEDRRRLNKSVTVVNLAAPLIRAVSGTEVLQDKKLDFVSMDDALAADADVISDAVGYAQYVSGYDSEQSTAREDAATCGIGATVTWLDMTYKGAIAGRPIVERVFPGYLFYDNSSRGQRLNERARWCGYADPVNKLDLDERIAELGDKATPLHMGGTSGGLDVAGFLTPFTRFGRLTQLDFVYNYFWWELQDIHDVANPFVDEQNVLSQLVEADDDVANEIGKMARKLRIDWRAPWWSLTPDEFGDLEKTMELVELLTGVKVVKLRSSKRKGRCYYKAQIARGLVLEKSKCYTQNGFPVNFITGYYDESQNIFYGMMRPLSYVQDALNITMSDFLGYAHTAAHGGAAYVTGPLDALEKLKKHKAEEDALTPLPEGATVTTKSLPDTGQSLVEFIRLMMEIMPRTLGLGQEFLGIITTGDMTDSLYGKVMRQSYAVLANFNNASASYSRRQGEIFVDIVRLMADAEDGKPLPVIKADSNGEKTFRLWKQNLSSEYMVRIVERPMTADERQDTFNKLSQLVPQYLEAGINIMPILSKYAPLDMQDRQELVQLSTPQPAQPDPLNEALLDSQARLQYAQADKLTAEAEEKRNITGLVAPEKQSIVMRNEAQAVKLLADAGRDAGALTEKDAAQMGSNERMHREKLASGERMHMTGLANSEKLAGMNAKQKPESRASA